MWRCPARRNRQYHARKQSKACKTDAVSFVYTFLDDGRGDDHDDADGAVGENDDAGDDDHAHEAHADEAEMGTALIVTICPRALFCWLRLGVRDRQRTKPQRINDCFPSPDPLPPARPAKPKYMSN